MNDVKVLYDLTPNDVPGFLLWQLSKIWQRHLERLFKDLYLTNTQAILLANIFRFTNEGKEATQVFLSETIKVDPMTTSRVIRDLEKKNLITRTISTDDKRAYYLLPSLEGKELAKEILRRLPKLQKEFFSPLGDSHTTFVDSIQLLIEANKEIID